jgi:hypothetical protein
MKIYSRMGSMVVLLIEPGIKLFSRHGQEPFFISPLMTGEDSMQGMKRWKRGGKERELSPPLSNLKNKISKRTG